jgi:hypothetical protein
MIRRLGRGLGVAVESLIFASLYGHGKCRFYRHREAVSRMT